MEVANSQSQQNKETITTFNSPLCDSGCSLQLGKVMCTSTLSVPPCNFRFQSGALKPEPISRYRMQSEVMLLPGLFHLSRTRAGFARGIYMATFLLANCFLSSPRYIIFQSLYIYIYIYHPFSVIYRWATTSPYSQEGGSRPRLPCNQKRIAPALLCFQQ